MNASVGRRGGTANSVRGLDSSLTELGDDFTVVLTKAQETLLFGELEAKRDEGSLAYALRGERRLRGTRDDLGLILHRLENARTIASALSTRPQIRRAQMLGRIIATIRALGVEAHVPEYGIHVNEDSVGEAERRRVPERDIPVVETKRLHHMREKRFERYMDSGENATERLLNELESGESVYDVTVYRRGRASGREAGKRAWNSKARPRAEAKEILRGDKVFRRGLPDALPIGKLNDDRSAVLNAGTNPGDRSESRDKTRSGKQAVAALLAKQKFEQRIVRAIGEVRKQKGRVRPSWIGDFLMREDILAGKYRRDAGKAAYMRRRYTEAARKRLDPSANEGRIIHSLSANAQRAAARRESKVVVRRPACEHAWRVSPQRTRRTCEACGAIERKRNGRWTPWTPTTKHVAEDSAPARKQGKLPDYEMKARTSRQAARHARRWS